MYKESEELELKKSLSQLKEGIISLDSMLNKSSKGRVIFGINDDGKIIGISISSKTKRDIAHEIQNNLKPLPNIVNIEEKKVEDKSIIEVYAEGDDTPYSAYGRFYIRLNDSDIMMQSKQIQYYFEKKVDNYYSWERQKTENTINDIDEDLLIDCVRTANEKGRMYYIYRNPEEALTKLGLLTDGYLNNAGLYLFGKNKPLKIKEATYPTDLRTEFGEIKEFRGNIIECIKESISYIQNHISYNSKIIGIQREENPEIPIRAIREIVVNSYAHCSYAKIGDCNTYTVFKSQVKIYNAGPIINNIDPIDFASGKIGSKIRNILISQVLYNYGYIDAFGTGFDRTFTLCSDQNVEYKYVNDDFGFTFIFLRNPDFINGTKKDNLNARIKNIDRAIIDAVNENKYVTLYELSTIVGKSVPTVQRHICYLVNNNIIVRVGSKKSGYWKIVK